MDLTKKEVLLKESENHPLLRYYFMIAWLAIPILIYGTICTVVYFSQEKLMFHPETLDAKHQFLFDTPFEEFYIDTPDNHQLHGLHFKNDTNDRVIVYYHGNAGSLEHWGEIADIYLNAGFNLLIYDFRGFGKSTGTIENEEVFLNDAQLFYDYALKSYKEEKITVVGYSMGSGLAASVSANNNPSRLILKTPYYAFAELASSKYPWLPGSMILKYELPTNEFLEKVDAPIHIFHGDADLVIPVEHSRMLKAKFPKIEYVEIPGQHHQAMNYNEKYQTFIASLNNLMR